MLRIGLSLIAISRGEVLGKTSLILLLVILGSVVVIAGGHRLFGLI